MLADSDEIWRSLVNSMDEDLPSNGQAAPDIETLPKLPHGAESSKQKFFVQKIVTEVYVYSDTDNKAYGSLTFQTDYILGEMTARKLQNTLERERRKRSK